MNRIIFAGLAIFFFAACQSVSRELTEEQKAAIAEEVSAIHDAFWDAWEVEDIDAGMSYYRHSEEFVFAREGRVFSGYAAFEEFVESFMEGYPDMEWARAETKVTVLGEDVVYFLDRGTVVVRDADGVAGPDIPFSYTHIWIQTDGEWKVQIAHAAYVE